MNKKLGKQIKTIEDLMDAALNKKSVACPGSPAWSNGSTPAAFMINQQGGVLFRLIKSGMYIYKKKEKRGMSENINRNKKRIY